MRSDHEEPGVLRARYYETEGGAFPVQVWIRSLPAEQKKLIGYSIKKAQWEWPLAPPDAIKLGRADMWELRIKLGKRNIARIFLVPIDDVLVLLHGFIKKTQNTPVKEINIAIKRLSNLRKRLRRR